MLTISGWSVGPDFMIASTTCPVPMAKVLARLAPGQSCTFQIIFQPKTIGAQSQQFSVFDSAGTQRTKLQGVGTRK